MKSIHRGAAFLVWLIALIGLFVLKHAGLADWLSFGIILVILIAAMAVMLAAWWTDDTWGTGT